MDRSLLDLGRSVSAGASILCVSQFTLYGDVAQGPAAELHRGGRARGGAERSTSGSAASSEPLGVRVETGASARACRSRSRTRAPSRCCSRYSRRPPLLPRQLRLPTGFLGLVRARAGASGRYTCSACRRQRCRRPAAREGRVSGSGPPPTFFTTAASSEDDDDRTLERASEASASLPGSARDQPPARSSAI